MRKNSLLSILLLLVITAASAQTERGDWLVGGNFNLNTTDNNTNFGFTPMAGYFFFNNFAAGGLFDFTHSKSDGSKSTFISAGPFARYYFLKGNLKPLIVTEFTFGNNQTRIGSTKDKRNYRSMLLGGGLAAFVNEHVAIETIAGYGRSKVEDFDGAGGFVMKIGFQVYLSPRKMVDTYRSNQ